MCGIVGALSLRDKKIEKSEIKNALNLISYRGPDASDIYYDEKIILGHNRLAIIDLSDKANQPMTLNCEKTKSDLVIVFNGEIYNYKELFENLKKFGHKFNSESDTEVILHSFEEWGIECLRKFRGMFSFAIWNKKNQELILARDRFGIKPLYFYKNENFLIFASEIKALLKFREIDKKINHSAIEMFLSNGWVSQPETFYENIFALESGMFMIAKAKNENYVKNSFADISENFSSKEIDIRFDEAKNITRAALLDSVYSHLAADVEVGAFLSGGIDSSAIVGLMRELGKEKITTVSAIFPNTNYDESKTIKLVSERFKTNHLNVKISSQDFIDNLDNIFFHIDQPTIDGVNTYFVSLAAKKAGLKVVLSGLGGDELFFGYPSFDDIPKIMKILPLLKNPIMKKVIFQISNKNIWNKKISKLNEIISSRDIPDLLNVYLTYRNLFSKNQINKIIPFLSHNLQFSISNLQSSLFHISYLSSRISFLEFTQYMKNQLLRDLDVFSMAHSIELRVPFVDNVLLDKISKIPIRHKLKNSREKFLLKETLKDLLPKEILNKKKQGFVLPIDLWIRNEARELIKNEISNPNFFDKKTIDILWNGFLKNRVHWSRIWSLFIFSKFIKNNF